MSIYLRYDGDNIFTFSSVKEDGFHEIHQEFLDEKLDARLKSCCSHFSIYVFDNDIRNELLTYINEEWKPRYKPSLGGKLILQGFFSIVLGGAMGCVFGALFNWIRK